MRKFGLVGFPLSHSFSKKYFTEKFEREKLADCIYELFPLTNIDQLEGLISGTTELTGLNITVPYKKKVLPIIDELDSSAIEAGAVNCIKINRSFGNKVELQGYNTDLFGFRQSIKPFLESKHEKALILGTGGSSGAVEAVLKKIGIECFFVTRKELQSDHHLKYDEINEGVINACKLIVNTTPLGMFPDIDKFPAIPYQYISSDHLLYDLVYNPTETQFLKFGKKQGAVTINGMTMLQQQAEKSWEIWNS